MKWDQCRDKLENVYIRTGFEALPLFNRATY